MPTTPILPPNTLDWRRLTGLPESSPLSPSQPSLTGKRILITGAAGSIGSALAQAIAPQVPASLILLDTSEHGLYQIDRELTPFAPISILGSVSDQPLLTELFARHRPQLVFHAAALKHVPLMERNPFAAVATNALGTYTLAQTINQTAAAHRAQHLILVSTDKAVAPHSLMGASKRIAELCILALATPATRMTAVRLGNVLGSHGSVVPLFLDQIAHGGPITVTHPEARRYLISLDYAVAALLSTLETNQTTSAPNPGTILIPDLGTPTHILDLARDLIAQHPTTTPVEIALTALRPGDKLEESLLSPSETWASDTAHGLRAITSPAPTAPELHAALTTLQQALNNRDLPSLLETILHLVPEYTPSALLAAQAAAQLPQQAHA